MQFLDQTLPTVAANLAFDEALLIEADAGRGSALLRLWDPPEFAVVLGASRRLVDEIFLEACACRQRGDPAPLERRRHRLARPGSPLRHRHPARRRRPGLSRVDLAHSYVLERIAAALRSAALPCKWNVLGRGDLVSGGRKFGGSAQRRLKNWFMVHCSILSDFPIERISRYLKMPSRQPEYRAGRSHENFLANLALPRPAVANAIRHAFSASTASLPVSLVPPALLESLLAEKFANRQWIERF